jgi:VanZ family protein
MSEPLTVAVAPAPPRRYHPALRLLLTLLLALGCIMLFVGQLSDQAPRWQRELWNMGHVGLFGGLALALWPRLRGRLWLRALSVLTLALLVGGAVELLQGQIGREASIRDLLLDVLGAAIGLFAAAGGELSPPRRMALGLSLLGALAAAASPVAFSGWDAWQARRQFPLLASFEAGHERYRVRLYGGTWGPVEKGALQLRIGGSEGYSGFAFDQLPPNWRGYGSLRLELVNAGRRPLSITCRINDHDHFRNGSPRDDRFNRRLLLPPGHSELRFDLADVKAAPEGRSMRMDDIAEFGCFVHGQLRRQRLSLQSLALEP